MARRPCPLHRLVVPLASTVVLGSGGAMFGAPDASSLASCRRGTDGPRMCTLVLGVVVAQGARRSSTTRVQPTVTGERRCSKGTGSFEEYRGVMPMAAPAGAVTGVVRMTLVSCPGGGFTVVAQASYAATNAVEQRMVAAHWWGSGLSVADQDLRPRDGAVAGFALTSQSVRPGRSMSVYFASDSAADPRYRVDVSASGLDNHAGSVAVRVAQAVNAAEPYPYAAQFRVARSKGDGAGWLLVTSR